MNSNNEKRRRKGMPRRPYPTYTLEEALRIARVIQESNAGRASDSSQLAEDLGTKKRSSRYMMWINSSAKYGLTLGGYRDELISLTDRGRAIVAPKDEDEQNRRLVDAALQPEVFGRFYRMLDGRRLPDDTYAKNTLQRELGIHPALTGECLAIIKANGLCVGILHEDGGSIHVRLESTAVPDHGMAAALTDGLARDSTASGRIFLGHHGDTPAVEHIRDVLDSFGIPYGTADQDLGEGHPISASMADEMRGCNAAVLVFTSEGDRRASDSMYYQLGAASVLYGKRVVVVREDGVALPEGVSGLPAVALDAQRPEEAALPLVRELRQVGVIRVTL